MSKQFEWRLSVAVLSAVAALSACAAQAPGTPVDMKQKIEGASNRLDHQELASQYERQALTDEAAARRPPVPI